MRRSIFLRTLGSYRTAILGWGLGFGFLMIILMNSFGLVIAEFKTPEAVANTFATIGWLWDYPSAGSSPGGYATAKYSGLLVLVGVWGLLAGTRLLRGEEESGQLDLLLSTPQSRMRVLAQKFSALLVAMLIIGACIGLGAYLGISTSPYTRFSFGNAMEEGLMVSLIAATFAALGVFVSQFTRHRGAAAGITGWLLALAFVFNSVSLVSPANEWIGRLSPVYYFRISKPLILDYGMNWGAAGMLALLIVVFAGLGAALFLSRDVGSVIAILPEGFSLPDARLRTARGNWSLASLLARSFALELPRALWWALGLGFFYFVITQIVHTLVVNLGATTQGTQLAAVFRAMAGSGNDDAFFLALLFSYLPLIITVMAVTQVSSWERVEAEGQLDLVLATPQQRAKVLLTRIGAAAACLSLTVAITYGAVAIAAARAGLSLDSGKLAQAVLGIIPFGLIVLGFGYLLATWIRRGLLATTLSFLLAIEYGVLIAGEILQWPDNVLRTSLFYYYRTPLVNGLNWTATAIFTGLAVIFTALAVWRFAAKDIGRWTFLPGLRLRRRRRAQAALAQ